MSEYRSASNPGVAAVLSFVFNGLGHLYNGQLFKGLILFFLSGMATMVFLIGSAMIAFWTLGFVGKGLGLIVGGIIFVSGLTAICVIGVYSIFDAYRYASRK